MKNDIGSHTEMKRDELMIMREEMRQLKTALESQRIINEKLLRNALKGNNSKVRRVLSVNFISGVVAAWGCYFLNAEGILGVPLMLGTIVIVLAALVINIYISRIGNTEWGSLPLAQLQELLVKRRRQRAQCQRIGIVVALIWLLFYAWELYSSTHSYFMLVACGIGFVAGGSAGLLMFRKLQRADVDMIKQIRNLALE